MSETRLRTAASAPPRPLPDRPRPAAGGDLRGALERAKARLDGVDLYPRPVELDRVRVVVAPWFFRLPGFRRYRGYALWRTILLRSGDASDDLITHELCHIWQLQHRPLALVLAWLRYPYRNNPFEREARRAVELTRS